MISPKIWLKTEAFLARILRKTDAWPAGYLRLLLRGHRGCFAIPTHLTQDEKVLLYATALTVPRDAIIVEIGSYLGASSCFLAAAASEIGAKVVCVDTWMNEGMSEGIRDTYREFRANTQRYSKWIAPLRMRSLDAGAKVPGPVSLLFVDGDHSYAGVVQDLQLWLPKMAAGGWLMMHDVGWAEGVQRALREIVTPREIPPTRSLSNLYACRVDPGYVPGLST